MCIHTSISCCSSQILVLSASVTKQEENNVSVTCMHLMCYQTSKSHCKKNLLFANNTHFEMEKKNVSTILVCTASIYWTDSSLHVCLQHWCSFKNLSHGRSETTP